MGIFLREEKGKSCRIRFVHESLQLQGKLAGSSEDFKLYDHYTPEPEESELGKLDKVPTGASDEDMKKVTINLGQLMIDIDNPDIPEQIKNSMTEDEEKILQTAFTQFRIKMLI